MWVGGFLAAGAVPQVSTWNVNVFPLRHNDRLSIGYCAYVLLVVDPGLPKEPPQAFFKTRGDDTTAVDSEAPLVT
jgi:hypothetical protein